MLLKQCQDGDSCEIFNNNSLNCFNYHDKGVKRRFPYSLSQTGQYTLLYIDEMCKKKCMKDDCPFAHNIQEQTYHPMKIKKEACKDRQYCRFNLYHQVDDQKEQQKQYDKICQNYCYNYHRPDEQEYYNQLRKKLQNQYEKMKEECKLRLIYL